MGLVDAEDEAMLDGAVDSVGLPAPRAWQMRLRASAMMGLSAKGPTSFPLQMHARIGEGFGE